MNDPWDGDFPEVRDFGLARVLHARLLGVTEFGSVAVDGMRAVIVRLPDARVLICELEPDVRLVFGREDNGTKWLLRSTADELEALSAALRALPPERHKSYDDLYWGKE